jgi:hypothetical protein
MQHSHTLETGLCCCPLVRRSSGCFHVLISMMQRSFDLDVLSSRLPRFASERRGATTSPLEIQMARGASQSNKN